MEYNPIEPHRPITGDHCVMCFALIGPLDVLGGDGEGGEELPSVDHGRRTDEGRDKKYTCLDCMSDWTGLTILRLYRFARNFFLEKARK